jgi:hypothetical protein
MALKRSEERNISKNTVKCVAIQSLVDNFSHHVFIFILNFSFAARGEHTERASIGEYSAFNFRQKQASESKQRGKKNGQQWLYLVSG